MRGIRSADTQRKLSEHVHAWQMIVQRSVNDNGSSRLDRITSSALQGRELRRGTFAPYGDELYEDGEEHYRSMWPGKNHRDKRIRPTLLRHRAWFPLAETGGGSELYFER
jgi:cell wall assembly regulator SMI1